MTTNTKAAPSAQAEPCQWCCGTGRFADHACRFCAGKAKGSVFAAPSAQAEPVAPLLFVAMDDDKRAHLTWCADEAAVREAVKEAMFWLPNGEELDADHAEQLDGSVAELLESGALTFEGDAPLYLYRVAAAPALTAAPSAQAEPCQWCCGTGRFADHACRFCAGKAKGSVFAAPPATQAKLPTVLFEGMKVYQALSERAQRRTTAVNVADVLDAVVRVMQQEGDA